MNRRYLVLGLSAVLALSLAVPALGGPGNPVAGSAASLAGALKKAKKAKTAADAAQSTANTALGTANSATAAAAAADQKATGAQTSADNAQTSANAAQASANAANANANNRLQDVSTIAGPGSENDATTDPKDDTATCPSGSQVTGGGFGVNGTDNANITVTGATSYGDNYSVTAEETDAVGTNWQVQGFAYCANK